LKFFSAEIDYRPMASIDEMVDDQDLKRRNRDLLC